MAKAIQPNISITKILKRQFFRENAGNFGEKCLIE